MESLNRVTAPAAVAYPERILQFGEGNFLRAFVDWIVYNMNKKLDFNSGVVVVQPIPNGMVDLLNDQDGLYHLNLQGINHGETIDSLELIDVITRGLNPYTQFDEYMKLAENPDMRFVVSNTTEAGITFDASCKFTDQPASSYPGKLTQLLYHRFTTFNGDIEKGWLIFPCELIFHNGTELNAAILRYIEHWNLGAEFENWYKTACGVYSTLVDRIVPGYPKDSIDSILDRIQLSDKLVVQAEIFHLWVIEAPAWVEKEFPASKAGLNVLFVPSEKPYHDRKVTLLNGPHSALAPVAYLAGLNTVRESVEHETVGRFVDKVVFGELLQTLDLPESELRKFANDVLDRFRNPFVKHFVTSIMLNAFPKFKTRDIPGLKVYVQRFGELPAGLVLGLAAIITYYRGGVRADGATIVPNDDAAIVELLGKLWAGGDVALVAEGVLGAEMIWSEDLNAVPGLTKLLTELLTSIDEIGMMKTIGLVVNSK